MGELKSAPPTKFFVAMLVAPDGLDHLDRFDAALAQRFGPIDLKSSHWPFELTGYYTDEMGASLIRRIVSFEKLFDPADLPHAKHVTNDLETTFAQELRNDPDRRIVNLDAGYLALGQLVLATTKGYAHRIYLRDGIWAEVTLRYFQSVYEKWQWTYPDYADGRYNDFWIEMREKLKIQIKETANNDDTGPRRH